MKATSVQNIKNVKDICYSIENHPMERESKLTIVASTDDDIFAFEFEGSDLLQSCKRSGLFTGWEKDQKIRELEKELHSLKNLKKSNLPETTTNEEPSSRSDILDLAKKCVCGKREQDYGTPESNFQLIADLWNQYLFKEPGAKEVFGIGPMDVAMMMGLMKIARIRNGGGSGDSFVDLAGYAACGGEIWHSNQETNGDSN